MTVKLRQRCTAVVERFRVTGVDCQRLVVADQRLLVLLQRLQCVATVVEYAGISRIDGQGLVIGRYRFLMATEALQRVAQIAKRFGGMRTNGKSTADQLK